MFDRFQLILVGIRAVKSFHGQFALNQAFVLDHFDILCERDRVAANDLPNRRFTLPDLQHLG